MSDTLPLFSLGERLGIFLTVEASLISVASVTFILCYALYRRLRSTLCTLYRKDPVRLGSLPDATSSDLFLNLMVAYLVQACGNLPDIKWMTAGAVFPGSLCTAQAVLKQVGIVGVSMTSLAIAFHTFSILVLQWKGPPNLQKYVIIGIWVFVAFDIGIASAVHRKEAYYGPTEFWCWIIPKFQAESGVVTEYLWVWLAGLLLLILYGIMFAVIRRWIKIAHGIHWNSNSNRDSLNIESDEDKKIRAVANSMLFYPAVYFFCFFPNTLSRWLYFTDDLSHPPPYQFTLFASSIYGLSGVFNLILFFITRPTVVVGQSASRKSMVLPLHRRHSEELAPNPPPKWPRLDYRDNHGILSVNIDDSGRPGSNFELQSPSRSKHRTRSSYDMPGVDIRVEKYQAQTYSYT